MTSNKILEAKLCFGEVQICGQESRRARLLPYQNEHKARLLWIKFDPSQNVLISWNSLKENSFEFTNVLPAYNASVQGLDYPL